MISLSISLSSIQSDQFYLSRVVLRAFTPTVLLFLERRLHCTPVLRFSVYLTPRLLRAFLGLVLRTHRFVTLFAFAFAIFDILFCLFLFCFIAFCDLFYCGLGREGQAVLHFCIFGTFEDCTLFGHF